MQCANCGNPLGVNFLRCPKCGAKQNSKADNGQNKMIPPLEAASAISNQHAVVLTPVAPQPTTSLTLPPLPPSSRKFPLMLLAVLILAAATVAVLIGNLTSIAVQKSLAAKFDGSWDRIVLEPHFVQTSWFKSHDLRMDEVIYEVSRPDGTIFYSGSTSPIKINDKELGNKEVLTATACVYLTAWYSSEKTSHCATETLVSSEKRFAPLSLTVIYDKGGIPESPGIAFQQVLQRTVFTNQTEWEQIKLIEDPVRLKVWVANSPNEAVQLKLNPSNTVQVANLRQGEGFAAFEEVYFRAATQATDVTLAFQFFTSASPDAASYPIKHVVLKGKTEAERLAELQVMADKTARHMVEKYYGGGRNHSASIESWKFNLRDRNFHANFIINWSGTITNKPFSIKGNFFSKASGAESRFELLEESNFGSLARAFRGGSSIKVGDVVIDVF
jgi:hypothetical protein